jgi:hypothetical protein
MKVTLLALFLPFLAHSATFEVIGPCSKEPLFQTDTSPTMGRSVGELSISLLNKQNIPYLGNERGIHSIFNTPIGDEALEIISDTEMRAFGWCYAVDGFEPGSYPNEYRVESEDSTISWYFGFAHYLDGEWVSQCTKSYTVKPTMFCD